MCARLTRSNDETFSMFQSKRQAYSALSVSKRTDSSNGMLLIVLGVCGVSRV